MKTRFLACALLGHLLGWLTLFPAAGQNILTNLLPGKTLVVLRSDPRLPYVYGLNKGPGGTNLGSLVAFNSTNGTIVQELILGASPADFAINQAADAIYVINTGSRTLMKVDVASFTVIATCAFTTPNTYSEANPLYLAAGRSNLVYFTDGGWSPGIYLYDFESGTNVAVFDDDTGAGGLALNRAGETLYAWRQYGWGAGNINSWVTRFDVSTGSFLKRETSFSSGRRDPLDTPIFLNETETVVFNKQQMFAATNLSVLIREFSENLYAINRTGSLAFGPTKIFETTSGLELGTLPFSTTVQSLDATGTLLFRYRSSPSALVVHPLAQFFGSGWETNQPPEARFTIIPLESTTLMTITFDASGSLDELPEQLQYRWDWNNDGVFDTPFTNQSTATHRYNVAGYKTVVLQVQDRYHAMHSTAMTFEVLQQEDPGQPGGTNTPWILDFAASRVVFDPVRPYAYVLAYANQTLLVLNLTNGLVQRKFQFDNSPQCAAITPNGEVMYVLLTSTNTTNNYLAEFELEEILKLREFEIGNFGYNALVTDQGLLALTGDVLSLYDLNSGSRLTNYSIGSSGRNPPALHPTQRHYYQMQNGYLYRYDLSPFKISYSSDSDSAITNVFCPPNGQYVITGRGRLYTASTNAGSDLQFLRSLEGGMVKAAAFDDSRHLMVAVGTNRLWYYNSDNLLTFASAPLPFNATHVGVWGENSVLAAVQGGKTIFQPVPHPFAILQTNTMPAPAFAWSPANAAAQSIVTFSAAVFTNLDQSGSLQYRWDWDDDGAYDTPFSKSPAATHRFSPAGTKMVALQIQDQLGATMTFRQQVPIAISGDSHFPGSTNLVFAVPFEASDVAFDPVQPLAYVAGFSNQCLAVVNLTNGFMERQVSFEHRPKVIALTPNAQRLYVIMLPKTSSKLTNIVAEFELPTLAKLREFSVTIDNAYSDTYEASVTDAGLLILSADALNAYWVSNAVRTSQAMYGGGPLFAMHPSQRFLYDNYSSQNLYKYAIGVDGSYS